MSDLCEKTVNLLFGKVRKPNFSRILKSGITFMKIGPSSTKKDYRSKAGMKQSGQ